MCRPIVEELFCASAFAKYTNPVMLSILILWSRFVTGRRANNNTMHGRTYCGRAVRSAPNSP